MPIRILHVLDTLETGGLENGVVRLIQRMNQERFEHIVCVIRRLGPLVDRLPRTACESYAWTKQILDFQS